MSMTAPEWGDRLCHDYFLCGYHNPNEEIGLRAMAPEPANQGVWDAEWMNIQEGGNKALKFWIFRPLSWFPLFNVAAFTLILADQNTYYY